MWWVYILNNDFENKLFFSTGIRKTADRNRNILIPTSIRSSIPTGITSSMDQQLKVREKPWFCSPYFCYTVLEEYFRDIAFNHYLKLELSLIRNLKSEGWPDGSCTRRSSFHYGQIRVPNVTRNYLILDFLAVTAAQWTHAHLGKKNLVKILSVLAPGYSPHSVCIMRHSKISPLVWRIKLNWYTLSLSSCSFLEITVSMGYSDTVSEGSVV